VDQDGNVLDILVQSRRNTKAAKRFLAKLMKTQRRVPRVLVTDKLRSYAAAHRDLMSSVEHRALSTCRSLTGLTAVKEVLDPLVMPGQRVVARPVTSFQTLKRWRISVRYSVADSRWRRGRKCGDIRLKQARNRWARPGDRKPFMACSRWWVD
jgi:hypothetical protein